MTAELYRGWTFVLFASVLSRRVLGVAARYELATATTPRTGDLVLLTTEVRDNPAGSAAWRANGSRRFRLAGLRAHQRPEAIALADPGTRTTAASRRLA